MKYFVRFVTHWRVELVLAVMVLSLGTTIKAQWSGGEWCSDVPVLSYESQINVCAGDPSDCYMCVIVRMAS